MGPLTRLFVDREFFRTRMVLGFALLALGLALGRRSFNGFGHDLAQLYVAGQLLRHGHNIYDWNVQTEGYLHYIGEVMTWGHFYTPASSVVVLPMTLLTYPVAREAWFFGGFVVMLYGLWRFMEAYVPAWDRSHRVLVLGLVMCSSCVRWACWAGQPASILLGLFSLFMVELRTGRNVLVVAYAGFMGALKVTLGMPFLLIVVALRRYGLAAAMLATWALLTLIGTFGHGGFEILADYRANMAVFEDPERLNYPDPRGVGSGSRTDWPYLLNAIWPNIEVNRLLGWVLTMITLAWLARTLWRTDKSAMNDRTLMLALIGPITSISMLAIYHHPYDIVIMLLPIFVYATQQEFRGGDALVYMLTVGAFAGLHQEKNFADLLHHIMGPSSVLIARPLACVVCIVALVTSCRILRQVVQRTAAKDG